MARPLEINAALIEKAKEYLVNYETVPSRAGLALYIGVGRDTIYRWEKRRDESDEFGQFYDILSDLDSMQEQKLLSNGLTSVFNSTITKLMLTKHGYSDRIEADHTTAGQPMQSAPTVTAQEMEAIVRKVQDEY